MEITLGLLTDKVEKILSTINKLEMNLVDIQTQFQIRKRRIDKMSCRLENIEKKVINYKEEE